MRFPPPIVAQADPSRLGEAGARCAPVQVGLVLWPDDAERTTIVVKASYRIVGKQLVLAAEHRPLVDLAVPSPRQGAAAGELEQAPDLVRCKQRCDVVLLGTSFAPKPVEQIEAHLRVGELMERSFCTVGPASTQHPLTAHYLREPDGESPAVPVGPMRARIVTTGSDDAEEESLDLDEFSDLIEEMIRNGELDPSKPLVDQLAEPEELVDEMPGVDRTEDEHGVEAEDRWSDLTEHDASELHEPVQHAAHASTCGLLTGDEEIALEGLMEGRNKHILKLPAHEPQVIYEVGEARLWPLMRCDTVEIDTEAQIVSLVWRGQVALNALGEPGHRIVVSLEEMARLRPLDVIYRELQRGHFSRAVLPGETETVGIEGDRDIELEMARLMTFDRTPLPALTMEKYAAVCAALAVEDAVSEEVLAAHGLDDDDWMLEERAWSARMASALERNDEAYSQQFGSTMKAARLAAGVDEDDEDDEDEDLA